MGEAEGHVGVLFDEEDGRAFLVQTAQDGEDFLHELGGQSHGGFVEDEEFRLAHQGAGHGEHLLLTATQRSGQLRDAFAQARENIHDHFKVARAARFVAADPGAELQVFHHGESAKDAAPFGHMGHAEAHDAVGGDAGQFTSFQRDRSFIGQHAGDGAESGRLAGAIGPDQGEDFAALHVKGDAFDRPDVAVAHHEIIHPEHGVTHDCPPDRDKLR